MQKGLKRDKNIDKEDGSDLINRRKCSAVYSMEPVVWSQKMIK
jgi:hypothetical protein